MTFMKKILVGGAAVAALATAAAPAAAQYAYGYANPYANTNQYGYANPYANTNQYGYANTNQYGYANTNQYGYANNVHTVAAQRCSAAVQNRLIQRTGNGISGIVGQLLGAQSSSGRVLSITQVTPNRNTVRVRGLATSGRHAGYGAYGAGAYGAAGYGYQPDLSFRCDVDYRGYVRNVDINRR